MIKDWRAPAIIAQVRRGAAAGVLRGIGLVERHAVRLITSPPKTGRIYRRRGVAHQASAPGQAPASDTGRLVASRRVIILEAGLRGRLTFGTEYALPLEVGTINMEPRPYARRSLVETRNDVAAGLVMEIRAALK